MKIYDRSNAISKSNAHKNTNVDSDPKIIPAKINIINSNIENVCDIVVKTVKFLKTMNEISSITRFIFTNVANILYFNFGKVLCENIGTTIEKKFKS